ncbi:FecR family protein, partial [Bacteroidota bacterium]
INTAEKIIHITKWKSIAAIAILLLAIGILARYNSKGIIVFNSYTTYITTDSIKNIILSDGSKIWLNKNSEIKVPESYKNRIVYLKGEAYFEIARDSLKPFLVKTNHTTTKVLGTSFNVLNTNNRDIISLLTGKIELYANNQKRKSIILNPGDKTCYYEENNQITKSRFDNKNFIAWKTGEITFKNTPLSSVLSTIANYYDLNFSNNIKDNKKYTLTANFSNQPLEKVISILELTWNVDISIENNTIYISLN